MSQAPLRWVVPMAAALITALFVAASPAGALPIAPPSPVSTVSPAVQGAVCGNGVGVLGAGEGDKVDTKALKALVRAAVKLNTLSRG